MPKYLEITIDIAETRPGHYIAIAREHPTGAFESYPSGSGKTAVQAARDLLDTILSDALDEQRFLWAQSPDGDC